MATSAPEADALTFYDDVLRVLAYSAHQRDPIRYAIDVFLDLRNATAET